MNNSKRLDKEIQDRIRKDIGNIKHENKQSDINEIVMGIKRYYNSNKYGEEDLFHRISKIESRMSSGEMIINAGISWFVVFIIGSVTADDGTYISFNNPITKTILIIFFILFGVLAIKSIINTCFNKENARTKYLAKNEIVIIENVIKIGKNKNKRSRFRRIR